MSAIDWTEVYTKYKGLWVALADDKVTVVGSGKTLKDAIEQARQKGYANPLMHRVPARVIPFIGGFQMV